MVNMFLWTNYQTSNQYSEFSKNQRLKNVISNVNLLAIWPFFDWASVWGTFVLLDVDSVLKSSNAKDSVLFNIFSGVLATITKREEDKGKFDVFMRRFYSLKIEFSCRSFYWMKKKLKCTNKKLSKQSSFENFLCGKSWKFIERRFMFALLKKCSVEFP